MKWISYGWSVLVGLVTVVIALSLLGRIAGGFEQLAIALLVLIYATIDTFTVTSGLAHMYSGKQARNRFIELMHEVGSEEYRSQAYREVVKNEDETIHQGTIKAYIRLAFLSLVYFMALWTLLTA